MKAARIEDSGILVANLHSDYNQTILQIEHGKI